MNSVTEILVAGDIVRLLGDLIADNDLGAGDRLPPIREDRAGERASEGASSCGGNRAAQWRFSRS